jgi:ketosteroid isomerase-like protein
MDTAALADNFFDSLENGDVKTIASMYDDEVLIWHNFTKAFQSKPDNLEVLRSLGYFAKIKYCVEHRMTSADGLAQRHQIYMREKGGSERNVPGSIFFRFRDDKIISIYEYYDSTEVSEIFAYISNCKQRETLGA